MLVLPVRVHHRLTVESAQDPVEAELHEKSLRQKMATLESVSRLSTGQQ
jgi:hypothetical protein